MDYSKFTDDELIQMYKEEKHIETLKNTGQLVDKLLINALYGALALKHFPLFNESLAAAITGNGRYYIRLMAETIEETLQKLQNDTKPYWIYSDTDSAYFSIDNFVQKYVPDKSIPEKTVWCDKFFNKIIAPSIENSIDVFASNLNSYNKEVIGAEREIIADKALWTAKKKYIARVRDSEGTIYPEDNPYMKIMGLEMKTGGVAPFTKKYLADAIPIILDGTEKDVINWLKEIKSKFIEVNLDNISKTIGISKLKDPNWGKVIDSRKVSIPFNSKAAIASNNYALKTKIDDKFVLIEPGIKCKFLYLKLPNPIKNDAFAFIDNNFAELFKDYIDYDKNWEKYFLKPLLNICEPLNINITTTTQEIDEW